MPKAYRDTYLRTPKSRYTGLPVISRFPNKNGHIQCGPFITLCLGSMGIYHVISESC